MVWLNKKDCKKIFKNQKSLKIVIFDFFILKISKKLIWNERELLKNIIIDLVKNGKYVISFTSLYDEENCDLEMSHLDDGGNKYKTQITNCSINGSEGYVENGIIKGFELKNGVKYKIEVDTDLEDYYACEVKIYANR